ncbi:uncharacterized protein LOC128239346 [Mya arenaria]|uniref:uncharacterized protein LOC128239346 n=1 Tax=Mya arenaria TaxID=6604 RepID=UPI0022E4E5CD|nr:uncharacterized protein LOC128239346 [Mya arenaria]
MEAERQDVYEQCGSNTEVTCLAKELDIIKDPPELMLGFTVLSDEKVVVLNNNNEGNEPTLWLYQSKTGKGNFERVNQQKFPIRTMAAAIVRLDSTKCVVVCDNLRYEQHQCNQFCQIKGLSCEWQQVTNDSGHYRYSSITVFSTEHDRLQCSFHMKTGMRIMKDYKSQRSAIALNNDILAVLFCPLKLELLNMKTGISESVNMNSFVTEMFSIGDEQPFMTMSISGGQTHLYISLAAGGGIRKLTKIDTNGHILATFVEVNGVEPGPIAAVGDGTLVFSYDKKLLLMSDDLKILATLKTGCGVNHMEVMQTKKGIYLYCLERNSITQYSLQ